MISVKQSVGTPTTTIEPAGPSRVRLGQIISALPYALDLTEGQPVGHAVQSCALGMKIAAELGFDEIQCEALYYALLLKDTGCSSNASRMFQILGSDERVAKREVKTTDWTKASAETLSYLQRHVRPDRPAHERLWTMFKMALKRDEQSQELISARCERGASIVRKMGFPEATSLAIFSLDEHWNGKGYPEHLRGDQIPLYSRITNLCQTLDVYATLCGPQAAKDMARQRSGRWFDPALVRIVQGWSVSDPVWAQGDPDEARCRIDAEAPAVRHIGVDDQQLDVICEVFAEVIDAKSPYTYRHSTGVASAAVSISRQMGLTEYEVTTVRRAALLHDIGKLSVSNAILEKPGKLTDEEWKVVRLHPYYTEQILAKVPVFRDFASVAAAHHEKLDSSGYCKGLTAKHLSLHARILTVSDVFDALFADRPYRGGLPLAGVFKIIGAEVPLALDADCYAALKAAATDVKLTASLQWLKRATG